jgi:hypothetical protein
VLLFLACYHQAATVACTKQLFFLATVSGCHPACVPDVDVALSRTFSPTFSRIFSALQPVYRGVLSLYRVK